MKNGNLLSTQKRIVLQIRFHSFRRRVIFGFLDLFPFFIGNLLLKRKTITAEWAEVVCCVCRIVLPRVSELLAVAAAPTTTTSLRTGTMQSNKICGLPWAIASGDSDEAYVVVWSRDLRTYFAALACQTVSSAKVMASGVLDKPQQPQSASRNCREVTIRLIYSVAYLKFEFWPQPEFDLIDFRLLHSNISFSLCSRVLSNAIRLSAPFC